MNFPEEYFHKEVRDGFEISSLMKRCWAAQLEVLEQFDSVCRDLGLRYFAAYGTLLGTVRHKGFIPWDDDIDVWMLREDMDRLINEGTDRFQVLGLELVTPYSEREYRNLCFRVNNTRKSRLDKEFLYRYWMFPFTAGVDVFALDYIPRNLNDQSILKSLFLASSHLGTIWRNQSVNEKEKVEAYFQLIEYAGLEPVEYSEVENQLWRISDRISAMYTKQEADQVAVLPYLYQDESKLFDKEWFSEEVFLEFEGGVYDSVSCEL